MRRDLLRTSALPTQPLALVHYMADITAANAPQHELTRVSVSPRSTFRLQSDTDAHVRGSCPSKESWRFDRLERLCKQPAALRRLQRVLAIAASNVDAILELIIRLRVSRHQVSSV